MSHRISLVFLALGGLAAFTGPATGDAGDPARLQRELGRLEMHVRDLDAAGRRAEALESVRAMARLDPEHPWAYDLALRLSSSTAQLDEAETLARSLGSEGAGLTYGLGQLAYVRGEYDAALERFHDAVALFEELGHPAGRAFSLKAIGLCHYRRPGHRKAREELARARTAFDEALQLFRELGDDRWVASVLNYTGRVEFKLERFDEALALHREALALQVQLGDEREQATTWLNIGFVLRDQRDDAGTIEALEKSLDLRRRLASGWEVHGVLVQIGYAHRRFGRRAEALDTFCEAAALALELGRTESAVRDLQNAGWESFALGRPRESAEQFHDAAELAGRHGLQALEASTSTSLVKALGSTGRLADALLVQRRALELYRELGRASRVLQALNNLGAIHYRIRDLDAAQSYLEQALDLALELRSAKPSNRAARDREALARSGLSVVLDEQGRTEDALAHQREALSLWEELEAAEAATARRNLAEQLWRAGRRDEARPMLEQALTELREHGELVGEAAALLLRARMSLEAGSLEEALRDGDAALALAERHGLRREITDAHVLRAAVHERSGDAPRALRELSRAVEEIERRRTDLLTDDLKLRFFAPTVTIYERAATLQARLEMPSDPAATDAFRMVERARARGLADLLVETAAVRESIPVEVARQERELADAVSAAAFDVARAGTADRRASAERRLVEAREALERFKVELRRAEPGYSSIAYPEAVGLDELQREILREGETLLRYFVGEDRALLWVVDREDARLVELGEVHEIEEEVRSFLRLAGRPGGGLGPRPESDRSAEKLASLIGVPGRSENRLLVVPDGPLHVIPFDALRRDGRYLIEDQEIVVVPSATVLGVMRRREAPRGAEGFLGAGDPSGAAPGSPFPELPYSTRALERIAAHFPPSHRVALRGPTFTKKHLLELDFDEFRFVHFATHGWLDPDDPRRVGLRLSAAAEDGPAAFLYPHDIVTMTIPAELVVLSACQSGLGELLPGEGLTGLTRAFLHAGAGSVLVSLWNVSDKATAEFMERFYAELDGRSAAAALRRSKLAFLRSERPALRQPYRWAPFVLVGASGSAALQLNPGAGAANLGNGEQ